MKPAIALLDHRDNLVEKMFHCLSDVVLHAVCPGCRMWICRWRDWMPTKVSPTSSGMLGNSFSKICHLPRMRLLGSVYKIMRYVLIAHIQFFWEETWHSSSRCIIFQDAYLGGEALSSSRCVSFQILFLLFLLPRSFDWRQLEVAFFWVSQFDTEAALGGLPLTDRWVVCIFPPLNLTFAHLAVFWNLSFYLKSVFGCDEESLFQPCSPKWFLSGIQRNGFWSCGI